ncbi:hypothetical protein D929_01683 [Enterococcus faecalis 02-MB-P-10]|uniref:hypothetical protein n=1 Tax=Enterococcus faecalis TaxID=1351 RepID=UPI000354147C|nr:hypothetical protein [Enterococcus faecalis]EPH73216.1 hypothetical protein D929_01683 [Enterococcus faecalis 02-MB-P-10]
MDEKKTPKNIYMLDKTKERLSRIAAEKHMPLGDLIEYMLDVIEREKETDLEEVLSAEKQNKKILSEIERQTEIITILFNELARTMQLKIEDTTDSLGIMQAKKLVDERQEKRKIQAMNATKYNESSVTNE